jgi:hypothetical protein
MPTVIVVAAKSSAFSLSETELLVGSVVVLALLVWSVFSRLHHRNRPESR